MLKEYQQNFAEDILDNKKLSGNYLKNKYFTPDELMNIYHNNHLFVLIDALKATYSCVNRLVGEEFFIFLVKKYIDKNPSKSGNLQNYGDDFYEFIKESKDCATLPYLSDIAQFERLYERCYHGLGDTFIMSSNYPIIDIWQLDENSEMIDINKGGQRIQINKIDYQVVVKLI